MSANRTTVTKGEFTCSLFMSECFAEFVKRTGLNLLLDVCKNYADCVI